MTMMDWLRVVSAYVTTGQCRIEEARKLYFPFPFKFAALLLWTHNVTNAQTSKQWTTNKK